MARTTVLIAAMGVLLLGSGAGADSYQATPIAFSFEDISGTGTRTLLGADDSYVSHDFGASGFMFPFYGLSYSTVFWSSNGLITFGSGTSSFVNTDLTSSPLQAAIAAFWDDLVVSTDSSIEGVYYELRGSGDNQRLILQWEDVRFFAGTLVNPMTFQAILFESGAIQVNYVDLVNGSFSDNGASATVGIKAAGVQGPDRLLLAFNNGPNTFVGSGQSTLISPVPEPSLLALLVPAFAVALRRRRKRSL